jgi:hypothetical protein
LTVYEFERRGRIYFRAADEAQFLRLRDWIESHDVKDKGLVERALDLVEEMERRE